jgi:hypothetical protein
MDGKDALNLVDCSFNLCQMLCGFGRHLVDLRDRSILLHHSMTRASHQYLRLSRASWQETLSYSLSMAIMRIFDVEKGTVSLTYKGEPISPEIDVNDPKQLLDVLTVIIDNAYNKLRDAKLI